MTNTLPICQSCEERPVGVLMRIGTRKCDWLTLSCDECLDGICEQCVGETVDGVVTCTLCLQTHAMRATK